MKLIDLFNQLPADRQQRTALLLCDRAAVVWNDYADRIGSIWYVDSVVGLRHHVDTALPGDAMRAVRAGADRWNVAERYAEPITALQDADLAFPDEVCFAYYAIYNGFGRYVAGRDVDPWLIVSQAISSKKDSDKWPALLEEAIAAT